MTRGNKGFPLEGSYRKAFGNIGIKYNPDINSGDPNGLAPVVETWVNGKRQPSGVSYGLEGIHVITDTMVEKVIFEDKNGELTAVGVQVLGGTHVKARKEVILSCGAYRTP